MQHGLLRVMLIVFIAGIQFLGNTSAQSFNGGLMAGFTACQIDGDRLGGYNKPGFTTGVFVNRKLLKTLGWQAELKYILKGAAAPSKNANYYKTALHYIELPFFFKYYYNQFVVAEAGAAPAYLWYATKNTGAGAEVVDYEINKIDYATMVGFSYLFNKQLAFNFRFTYSLKPVSYQEGNRTKLGYGQFNNVISLAVYYTIK